MRKFDARKFIFLLVPRISGGLSNADFPGFHLMPIDASNRPSPGITNDFPHTEVCAIEALSQGATLSGLPFGRANPDLRTPVKGEAAMKLLVLGATGGIGKEIVRQAADRDHTVTAFVRAPERLKSIGARFGVIQGDPLSSTELARAIEKHDAILSGFGPRVPIAKTDSTLLHRFGVALSDAMRKVGIRRAVIVSTAFLFKDAIIPPANLVGRLFFPNIVSDAAEMESFFEKSTLDWTFVRPPRLTNRPRRGRYRVREGHLPGFGFTISRADVAAFMIKTVENHAFVRKVVGVSN